MNIKKMGIKRTFIGIGSIFLIIGIVLAIASGISISEEMDFKNNADTTEAVITDIVRYHSKNGSKRRPVIKYTVNGREYQQTLSEYHSGMSVGDSITVYYDPNDPANVSSGSLFSSIMVTGAGVLFAAIGGVFIGVVVVSLSKRKRLMQNGDALTGIITDVRMNMSVRINRRHPFKAECEVNDPYTSERYLYSSENITEDISGFIGSEVTVYVDKNDKRKYYVDIYELINKYRQDEHIHDYR